MALRASGSDLVALRAGAEAAHGPTDMTPIDVADFYLSRLPLAAVPAALPGATAPPGAAAPLVSGAGSGPVPGAGVADEDVSDVSSGGPSLVLETFEEREDVSGSLVDRCDTGTLETRLGFTTTTQVEVARPAYGHRVPHRSPRGS